MIIRVLNLISVAAALAAPLAAHAASFDCKKAVSYAEKEICRDLLLGKLDDALGENYKYMSASNIGAGALKDLKSTQRAWLGARNKCTTMPCLVDAYRKRIDEVCEYPVITGVHPICRSADEVK